MSVDPRCREETLARLVRHSFALAHAPRHARVTTRARASTDMISISASAPAARPRAWRRARTTSSSRTSWRPAAFDAKSTPIKLDEEQNPTTVKIKRVAPEDLPPLPPLPDLRALAEMAAMDITDEEIADWTPKVHGIINWFGQLRELDLSDVEEYEAPGRENLMAEDWMREDEPVEFDNIEAMLKESSNWEAPFIKVPAAGGSVGTDFGSGASTDAVSAASGGSVASAELTEDLLGMELKVGKVLSVENHPESDKLYIETVECGEGEPRLICSGLAQYMSKDVVLGKLVVVVANLKPRNMAGVKSNGMLLAASDAAHENVELLVAPEGSTPGERITWGDAENIEPHGVNKVAKKKIWEDVSQGLGTDGSKGANWKGAPMMTSAGLCTCASLTDANVG